MSVFYTKIYENTLKICLKIVYTGLIEMHMFGIFLIEIINVNKNNCLTNV